MKAVTVKFPETLDNSVEHEAKRQGVGKSDLIRKLVEEGLRRRRSPDGPSAYDLMKDACGIIAGGPRDLSHNKKHMKGYGK